MTTYYVNTLNLENALIAESFLANDERGAVALTEVEDTKHLSSFIRHITDRDVVLLGHPKYKERDPGREDIQDPENELLVQIVEILLESKIKPENIFMLLNKEQEAKFAEIMARIPAKEPLRENIQQIRIIDTQKEEYRYAMEFGDAMIRNFPELFVPEALEAKEAPVARAGMLAAGSGGAAKIAAGGKGGHTKVEPAR